jgi:ABC-type lipopolysaccharide export system ATPase subunit
MTDKPNDAVTNTADLMINYTDDEIKAEVWAHIRKIVEEVVREEVRVALTDHSVTERIVVNHAYRIEQMAKHALKNAVASINVY